jgi:hypothetical protein
MKRLVHTLLFALALLAAAPRPAHAADGDDAAKVEAARQYFDAGKQAYEGGQYLVAIAAFEEAMKLSPRPPVIFSLAQAYRRQYFVDRDPAKLKRGLDLYKQYIVEVKQGGRRDDAVQYIAELEPMWIRVEDEQRKAGKDMSQMTPARASDATQLMISSRTKGALASIDGGEAAEVPLIREVAPGSHKVSVSADGYFPEEVEGEAVDGRLVVVEVNLKEMPARLTVRTTAGADVTIDGRPAGTAPFSRPLEVPAGKHFVTISKRGHHPVTREVTLERGKDAKLVASLDRTTQRRVSYWVLGAAGVALLGGGGSSLAALSHQGNAETILDKRSTAQISQDELDEYTRERQSRDDLTRTSYFLYGAAGALAATGVLLYFIDSPRVEALPPPSSVVVPTAASGFLGAVWMGRF